MRRLCVAAMVLLGCADGSTTDGDTLCAGAAWSPLRADLDRSALAIWGTADDDVYVVGGPLGAPGMSLLTHWDGRRWTEIPTGSSETLWWVWGAPGDAVDLWMVGENGTVLRYDGRAVREMPTGTAAHFYGVWGAAADDVYLVGGRPGPEESPDDVVLHWDGRALAQVELPEAKGAALFKVWGAGGEVYVSGEAGTMWHRTASGWVDESLPTLQTLSTVHGCAANDVWAVGGQQIFHRDAAGWTKVPVDVFAIAAGVSCGDDAVLVVGSGGLKLRYDRGGDRWFDDTLSAPYDTDFHGAWVSPRGETWAAGGNYIAPASQIVKRTGVVARRGCGAEG
jgi:hypothetical protein